MLANGSFFLLGPNYIYESVPPLRDVSSVTRKQRVHVLKQSVFYRVCMYLLNSSFDI